MNTTPNLPANDVAERIVRHFQAEGFAGISEALIIRIRLRAGDKHQIDAAFESALEQDKMPPVHQSFEIHPYGHFAETRSFAQARTAIQSDFTASLRMEIPRLFFNPAPVVVDDAFATGTKYDAMIKLSDNVNGYAFAILLNDPGSSFLEYLGTHHGDDWQKIMGNFGTTTEALGQEFDLL